MPLKGQFVSEWSIWFIPPRGEHKDVAVLAIETYLDESGDSSQATISIVAGLIGSSNKWRLLEDRWRAATNGRVFHARDFFAREAGKRQGAYKHWTDAQAAELVSKLCDAIESCNLTIMGAVVDVKAFKSLDVWSRRYLTSAPIQRQQRNDKWVWRNTGGPTKPYFLGFTASLSIAAECTKLGKQVHFWIDRQTEYEPFARKIYDIAVTSPLSTEKLRRALGNLVYADKALYPGLQAADFVAYVRCAIQQANYRTDNIDLFTAANRLKALPKERQKFLEFTASLMRERIEAVPAVVRQQWSEAPLRTKKTGRRRARHS